MRNSVFVPILAIAMSGASLADENVTGRWDCKMVSEYGDFEFELTLSDDSSYANRQDMFGEVNVDTGSWSVEGEELVMNRKKVSTNGEEKDSDQQFRRQIVSISDATLKLKHDEIVTTCTRM